MDEIQYIRGLQKYQGLSLREITRQTGRCYETVAKYVDQDDWNVEVKPRKVRESKLDVLKPVIDEWLAEDLKMPRKQRHTGVRVYARLQAEYGDKLRVGKQTVINYVGRKKRELYVNMTDTAIRGYHEAGWAQLDFGEVQGYNEAGTMTLYHELVISFPQSNGSYVQLCESENQECLMEGMQAIFEHMGGVPTRILFDNMSTAVAKILPKRERKLAEGFGRFVLHHGFKAVFCRPNAGQEKGNVENKVGYNRRNFMVPLPSITDLREYNQQLLVQCEQDMERVHYEKGKLIRELFEADRRAMLSLPKTRFKVIRLLKAKADNYSFIRFENNRYSSAPKYKRRELWLEVSAEEIRILDDAYQEICRHKRVYEKQGEPMIDWLNYLPAIQRKPNAFRYTQFFQTLPDVWRDYFEHCTVDEGKDMLSALVPIIVDGKLPDATAAMELLSVRDADSFLASYRSLTEACPHAPEVTTPNTPAQTPYRQDLSVYSRFMDGGEQ